MFTINPSIIPQLRTRQALLVIDLQNDFVSADGALAVTEPEGFVSQTLALARAFQDSDDGLVIWVSSEFDAHQPASGKDGDWIIATARGRQAAPGHPDEAAAMEADEEAFLSGHPGTKKPACVRTNTNGVELAAEVQQAMDRKDFTLTKTHYSAFAAQRLIQILRANFVTELYLCGALTNISIYATALHAGQYGYDITLVEDCCGYRNPIRHSNAVHRLRSYAGCKVVDAEEVVMARTPPAKPDKSDHRKPKEEDEGKRWDDPSGENMTESCRNSRSPAGGSKKSPVCHTSPAGDGDDILNLQASLEKLTLSGASFTEATAKAASPSPPTNNTTTGKAAQPLQTLVETSKPPLHATDTVPLEVDTTDAMKSSSPGGDPSSGSNMG